MSRGYWYTLIAVVGWLVFGSLTYAQEQLSPSLESQPVTPSQQGDANSGKQDSAPDEQPKPEILTPALQKIESAIREIVPPKDEGKYQRQEARDKGDLRAQEDMAFWAKFMFWATAVAAAITFCGLVLIGRTLHYTRIAANHTQGMLEEAKTTTTAAVDAAKAAKKSAELQEESFRNLERPYLFIVIKETRRLHRPGNEIPHLKYTFSNYGKTPAILEHLFIELRPIAELKFVNGMPRIPMNLGDAWYDVIAPGGTLSEIEPRMLFVKDAAAGDAWAGKKAQELALHGSVGYQDPSGNHYTDHFVMVGNEGGYSFQLKARKQTTNL